MSGNIDYLLKNVGPDSPPQDALFKGLTAAVDPNGSFSSFAIKAINGTTTLPLGEAH